METKHVVVLGAGFGGFTFCQTFDHPDTRITLVDRQNHHLFQPLLYQVATAGLSAPEIAQPIRSILSDRPRVTVLLDSVVDFNLAENKVVLETNTLGYDYLVLALGGVTSYFGHPEWEQFAPGLKSLDDALRIRRHILLAFEKAENAADVSEHDRLMTIVVVGGGPTGVEVAGAFAELDRAGRVKVNPDLSLPGHPEVFAIGDMALVLDVEGNPVPGVSPAAMQMAKHVARIIRDELDLGRQRAARPAFRYWDKGTMATIGRSAAVAKIGKIEFNGFLAWVAWLFIHLIFLVGFRNRLAVLLQWAYSYVAYKRGARIVTGLSEEAKRTGN